jgi:hypothetical protein
MKVEGLLHKTYGIFVNDYHFANPCFGYRLAHIVVHITWIGHMWGLVMCYNLCVFVIENCEKYH